MSQVTFRGTPINVLGHFPQVGEQAPDFTLTSTALGPISLADFAGKKLVLSIFPSIDTGVCAQSVRAFNSKIAGMDNGYVLAVSADLPFAASRFCELEGIEKVQHASVFRSPTFAQDYGVAIADGPIAGLTARAVICIDEQQNVIYSELVSETANEPDYDAALAAFN
ncbi:putative thiol peroxidase [Shewanella sp. NFH-SH190041]|uniref:thiol peroxidase n=1 Tax=Shewanella sp. NFH-SH190041 TaxID=2950245 RepID=UPI0021C441E2|nr:thiol peroxidase [Shewanella sp. NFH-SH190041]BDM63571.1 putative thiol peroxidase [Shewanella sp. NFH-SH190041]